MVIVFQLPFPIWSFSADPAMMGFVNLYYPGPPGPYGTPGPTPTGILTPTGFYPHPHHPNPPLMVGPPSGPSTPFNAYPTMLQPSYPTTPYIGGQSAVAGLTVPSAVPVTQPMLSSSPLAYTSPLYWNTPVSASMIAASLGANTTGLGSTAVTTVADMNGTNKSNLVTGTNPYIDVKRLILETETMKHLSFVMENFEDDDDDDDDILERLIHSSSLGRRGWKVYYARLRDLVLYLYKNAMVANAAARAEELHNLHQQQLQQHHNCLRQLAMQQQQQHQRLVIMHPPEQPEQKEEEEEEEEDGSGGGVKDVRTHEESENPSGAEQMNGSMNPKAEREDSSVVSDCPTSYETQEPVTSPPTKETAQSTVSLNSETKAELNGSNKEMNESNVSHQSNAAETEPHPHPKSDQPDPVFSSPSISPEAKATNSHSPSPSPEYSAQPDDPSASNGTAATNNNLAHPYSTENQSTIASAIPIPTPLGFGPTSQAALAFPPPPTFVPPAIPPPEAVIRIAHAIASRATDYLKKPNVFRLKTREGAEYLFEVALLFPYFYCKNYYLFGGYWWTAQLYLTDARLHIVFIVFSAALPLPVRREYSDAKELDMWVERINFVAALLSAPAIPGPIGSERGFYRPHLPVTCTKLNMPTRASSISGRTSDAARAAAAAVLARAINKEPKWTKKDDTSTIGNTTSTETDSIGSNEQRTEDGSAESSSTIGTTNSTSTTAAPTSSSSTVSLISVFSTSSLGRRRKTSSGSLCGTADTTLGPVLTAKQRAEHEERIQFTEAEIHRYKTYARLLEAELFRIQQSSAAVAHAAALAAANNFSPYMNPYNPLPGNLHGFQHYGPIGFGSGTGIPFSAPIPVQSPRYFLPRDHPVPAYATTPNMLPLAVLGPSDPLSEESTNTELTSDPANSISSSVANTCVSNPPLPSMYSIPTAVPVASRPRSLPYSYYGPQLAPPSSYSPSVSGRFYSHPRQLRNPHHYRQQQQQLGFGAPGSVGFGRSNGMMMMMNGHRLAEEDSTSESPPSPSSDPATVSAEGESS
ncbi:unnamed protein product, partial [Echinostoma caproni]|uniref:PH_9 domain-containing protein n=1 Tax=Echinostoma caproni TaxID=27848 RepID=A0A183APZ4_9TREM